jgi:alpha-tubulin suppressor-like RCC1 family protein
VARGAAHSLALTDTGQVFAFGLGSSGLLGQGTTASSSVPVAVSGLTDVVAIAVGANHSLAVTAAGEVWAWGDNMSNQARRRITWSRRWWRR